MEKESRKSERIVKLEQFTFSYGATPIFDKVNLSIETGRLYGIVGDNGAGKTTLFNIISGIIPINKAHQLLPHPKDIAFLQATPYFYPYMTGLEYLKIVGQNAVENLNLWNSIFQLPLKEYIHNYSTGMQKKLSIISILLLNKKTIIMDEPFSGLDLKSTEIVNLIIARLKETGTTILLSSHIVEPILYHADKVIVVKNRQLSQEVDKSQFDALRITMKEAFISKVKGQIDKLIL